MRFLITGFTSSIAARAILRFSNAQEETDVLADSLVVTTVAVSDLERSKRFYAEQLGLPVLDEQPFAIRFGAGHGSQISVRPGQPNVGRPSATSRSPTSKAKSLP